MLVNPIVLNIFLFSLYSALLVVITLFLLSVNFTLSLNFKIPLILSYSANSFL